MQCSIWLAIFLYRNLWGEGAENPRNPCVTAIETSDIRQTSDSKHTSNIKYTSDIKHTSDIIHAPDKHNI